MADSGDRIVLSDGSVYQLGRQLGRGGEGAVFEVAGRPEWAAKVYHQPVTADKAAKFKGLLSIEDPVLERMVAWPKATIVDRGAITGFVMPRLSEFRPLHELYGPSTRRQHFPTADWSFLVHAARNLSAAFARLHAVGVVVGDVNESLAFVHPNKGLVRLIDTDSMQVRHAGRVHRCEVGVPLFTPPELHVADAFRRIDRTPQHDAFGLAVLIFHLLFFGRHPYAGVPVGNEDLPIDKAIPGGHYAYRADTSTTRLRPPPNTVPMKIAGEEVARMFERAFAPNPGPRPSAEEWFRTLGTLKDSMVRCSVERAHVYPNHLTGCPWCEFEQRTAVSLFVPRDRPDALNIPAIDVDKLWEAISSIPHPDSAKAAKVSAITPLPPPVPARLPFSEWLNRHGRRYGNYYISLGVLGLIVMKAQLWYIWVFIGSAMLGAKPDKYSPEHQRRLQARTYAEQKFQAARAAYYASALPSRFDDRRALLEKIRNELKALPGKAQQERNALRASVRNRQLDRYLEQFLIRDAGVSGIGYLRKETLASFGITTAADLDKTALMQIAGFGPALVNSLMEWRSEMAKSFVFDSKGDVDPQDLARINRDFIHRQRKLVAALQAGAEDLKRLGAEIEAEQARLLPELQAASAAYDQADVDFKALE